MESKKKKKERQELMDTKDRLMMREVGQGGKNVKKVKRCKLPVISLGDLMYSMVTTGNNTILYFFRLPRE